MSVAVTAGVLLGFLIEYIATKGAAENAKKIISSATELRVDNVRLISIITQYKNQIGELREEIDNAELKAKNAINLMIQTEEDNKNHATKTVGDVTSARRLAARLENSYRIKVAVYNTLIEERGGKKLPLPKEFVLGVYYEE